MVFEMTRNALAKIRAQELSKEVVQPVQDHHMEDQFASTEEDMRIFSSAVSEAER